MDTYNTTLADTRSPMSLLKEGTLVTLCTLTAAILCIKKIASC